MTKKVEVDEISIKDLTKTIAKSTGNKNLNKALKKSKDQTKMDLAALRKKLQTEKTLSPAEIKKREEIAKAMERDNPDMPMAKKMAIATATAKKVAEDVELDEGAKEKALKALMTKALGGKRAKPGYTSAVANNGDFVVKDGGGRIVGRIKSGDYTNPLKESVELEENRVDTLAKDFHNRLKKAGNSDRNQNRERMATLAKAKKQGLSPIEMKQLDGKMNAVMNKMDESVDLDEVLDTPKAMQSYRDKSKRSKEKAASSAVAKMMRSKDKDSREHPAAELKTMAKRTAGQKMADRNAARKTRAKLMNQEAKAPKIDDAKYAAHMDRLKKPKKMSSTQKTLADIRKRAEK